MAGDNKDLEKRVSANETRMAVNDNELGNLKGMLKRVDENVQKLLDKQ